MDQQQHQMELNSINSSHVILNRLNSTSTMILDEAMLGEQIQLPTRSVNRSVSLRSLLKTSGLFNKDLESSDKLNELFANGTEFTLHRLLSDFGVNDINIDMNDLVKFDPMKLLDAKSVSEFLQGDSFDQINTINDIESNHFDSIPPSAIACSSGSFTELCSPAPELSSNEVFHFDESQLKLEPENPLVYTQLNSFDDFTLTPTTSGSFNGEFNFDPSALAAIEHDYGFLSKRSTVIDTPSPSPTISKRTPTRVIRRTSSRLQSRAALNDNLCLSPTTSEDVSTPTKRGKHGRHISRALDVKTEDDLSYYLERRRKNNEASKMSRAARKEKFGNMDSRCMEYERVNAELRLKITTLETVTANLKSGLIHTFQRKSGV
jgi:hypothetical protein